MTKRFAPKPSGTEPSPSDLRFGLRFISGKYQGGEYPLGEGQEIVIKDGYGPLPPAVLGKNLKVVE